MHSWHPIGSAPVDRMTDRQTLVKTLPSMNLGFPIQEGPAFQEAQTYDVAAFLKQKLYEIFKKVIGWEMSIEEGIS